MFKKNKNYKVLLGVIVGVILSVTIVSAATYYGTAAELTYDNTTSGLSSSNVQDALDELYNAATDSCPAGNICIDTPLSLGDYVSYTPTVTSYETDTTMTGYSSSQTINPSELNLWRVLNINDDGTVDIISEYVSSTAVYFSGQTGYLNFVGYLNILASQYENSTYTVGSRHFGYNRYKSQTQYITDTSRFTTTNPITSSTIDNSNESQGGGDTLYLEDFNKVKSVLGTAKAYNVSATTREKSYWMASRYYYYDLSSSYKWNGRIASGGSNGYLELYYRSGSTFYPRSLDYSLRPIVTLKSGLQYTGEGTSGSPWTIAS